MDGFAWFWAPPQGVLEISRGSEQSEDPRNSWNCCRTPEGCKNCRQQRDDVLAPLRGAKFMPPETGGLRPPANFWHAFGVQFDCALASPKTESALEHRLRRAAVGAVALAVFSGEKFEEGGDGVLHLLARDDLVDEAVLEEEFGGLEAFGQFFLRGFLDDAGAGEADTGAGFGEDDIAEGGEAGHDASHGGVGEDGEVGEVGLGVAGEGGAGFGHLHEAVNAFIHAGTAGGGDDDGGDFFVGGAFDGAGDFFADDGAHAGTKEAKVHHGEADGEGIEGAGAGDDGVGEAGAFAVLGEFVAVRGLAGEVEGVGGAEVGVEFLPGALVDEEIDAAVAIEGEMVTADGDDVPVGFEVFFVDDFAAEGAFFPQALGDVLLLDRDGRILGFGKKGGHAG